jgi:hypothetical protein
MYAQSNVNNLIHLLSTHTTVEKARISGCHKRREREPVIITFHQLHVSTPATAASVGPTRWYLQSVGVGGTIGSTSGRRMGRVVDVEDDEDPARLLARDEAF